MSHAKKPAIVLSGFLGSGKTTLLNKIMGQFPDLKLALIINEFGDIGLDASLLKTPGEFVEMNNGCLCCALNDDLVSTLETLAKRDDYDAVIVETSGIAEPLTIGWTFLRPQFQNSFSLNALITVVDALQFEEQKKDNLYLEQIRPANLIYLSKTENAGKEEISLLKTEIMALNPGASLYQTPPLNWFEPLVLSDQQMNLIMGKNLHDHTDYESISLNLENKQCWLEKMEDFFETLPKNALRAKAVFHDFKEKKFYALHLVCGRITFEELNRPPAKLALVIIGKHLNNIFLDELL